jgi:hypothetical protein
MIIYIHLLMAYNFIIQIFYNIIYKVIQKQYISSIQLLKPNLLLVVTTNPLILIRKISIIYTYTIIILNI